MQSPRRFWNELISRNAEQRAAVARIAAGAARAPYVVLGPPGTGKTMTIVEAIIQVTHIRHRSVSVRGFGRGANTKR